MSEANQGSVISVRGSVVDVRFENRLPPIYSVLHAGGKGQIGIEVLAQRDARHVRGIAFTPTQGLARGIGERCREGEELYREMTEAGVLPNMVMLFGQMNEPPGSRFRVGHAALTMAEYFRDDEHRDVLLLIDNIFRFIQAGMEVSGLMGQMPSHSGTSRRWTRSFRDWRNASPIPIGVRSLRFRRFDELLQTLHGDFHHLRQSGIGEELFDVISGYEALEKNIHLQ